MCRDHFSVYVNAEPCLVIFLSAAGKLQEIAKCTSCDVFASSTRLRTVQIVHACGIPRKHQLRGQDRLCHELLCVRIEPGCGHLIVGKRRAAIAEVHHWRAKARKISVHRLDAR